MNLTLIQNIQLEQRLLARVGDNVGHHKVKWIVPGGLVQSKKVKVNHA